MVEVKRVKVCLVGSGRMGAIRAKALYANPLVDFVGILTQSTSGKDLADLYKLKQFSNFKDLMASGKDVEAFVVCSTTSLHKKHIEEILAVTKAKFIFIEKPVDGNPNVITELFAKCKLKGVILCCSFQRRFDQSYVNVHAQVTSGAIGKINYARVFFADHPVPKLEFLLKDGCPFMDLTPHDIDYLLWCINDEVVSVSASTSATIKELKDAGVEDSGVINLKFKRGCLAHIYFNRACAYGYDQRCEFFGDKGAISVENQAKDSVQIADANGLRTSLLKYSFPQRFEQGFQSEIDTFVKVALGQVSWPIDEKACTETQKIAMAAASASKKGCILDYTTFKP